jgi:hypothetical protein
VNRYISVEQLTTDARVAGLLCVGGPVKYSEKHGSHVTIVPVFSNFKREPAGCASKIENLR